jgi:hypothetical protein
LTWSDIAARKCNYGIDVVRTGLSQIARSWRTFLAFWRLPMCLNPMNKSWIMFIERCWWLLEISVWSEGNDLVTLEFGLNQNEIEGNSEYRSHRGFHKLYQEGRNVGLWCQMKKLRSCGVGGFSRYDYELESIFKFLLVFKICFLMQYECMMPCNMSDLYVPYQKKKRTKYRWRTYSWWQSRTHPRS